MRQLPRRRARQLPLLIPQPGRSRAQVCRFPSHLLYPPPREASDSLWQLPWRQARQLPLLIPQPGRSRAQVCRFPSNLPSPLKLVTACGSCRGGGLAVYTHSSTRAIQGSGTICRFPSHLSYPPSPHEAGDSLWQLPRRRACQLSLLLSQPGRSRTQVRHSCTHGS